MARLPLLGPEDAGPAAARLLRRIGSERRRIFNVYRLLAHSPGVLEHVYGLASYLWNESELPPALQELVILRVAQLTGSDYEWNRHLVLAERVGVPAAQIDALGRWEAAEGRFDPGERAALALADEATREVAATAATVRAVRTMFGNRATLELTALVGLYGMVARLLRSLDLDPEAEDTVIPDPDIYPK